MSQKLPLLLVLVALVGGGLYFGLGSSDDPQDAPEIQREAEGDQENAGVRTVNDAGIVRDDNVTRTEARTEETEEQAPENQSIVAPELSTRIRGRVVDIRTGEGISEARVTLGRSSANQGFAAIERDLRLRDRRPIAAVTDSDGWFDIGARIDWIAEDMIRAQVSHERYQPVSSEPSELRIDQVNDLGLLQAIPAPILSLQVVDSNGEPIAGAKVRKFDSAGPSVEFLEAPSDEGEGSSTAVSFTVSTTSFEDGPTEFSDSVLPFALGDLDGRVRLAEWTTDQEGRCEITCEPGEVGLKLRHEEHATIESRLIMPEQGGLTERVTMLDAATLNVILTDAQGNPVVGRKVEAKTDILGTETTESDENGIATFTHLPIGFVRVGLGRKARSGIFVVGGSDSSDRRPQRDQMVEAELFPGRITEVRLDAAPRAIANVIVSLDGVALEGARVSARRVEGDEVDNPGFVALDGIFGGENRARTDAEGRIALTDLELGTTQFTIRHRDLTLAARRKAELVSGEQDVRFDFVTSRIAGRVLGPDGQPVENARVQLVREGGPESAVGGFFVALDSTTGTEGESGPAQDLLIGPNDSRQTDIDGRFEFRLVPPDQALTVRVRADEGQGEYPQEIRPREGERVDLGTLTLTTVGRAEITVNSTSEISVVVAQRLDANGEPVGDQQIQPAVDGEVTFESLLPGLWRFRLGFGPTAITVERQIFSGRTATLTLGE